MNDPQEIYNLASKAFSSTERSNVEASWELLSEFILPNQSGIFHGASTPGEKKTKRLHDSTAVQAAADLSAAIHSTLTNPSTKWSKLQFKTKQEGSEWLEEVINIIHSTLNETNFDTEIAKGYRSYTALANMVLFHDEYTDPRTGKERQRFKTLHLSEVAWEENHLGRVDTLYRRLKYTAKQAVEEWGEENLPRYIQEKFKSKSPDLICFTHYVYPRGYEKLNDVGLAAPKDRPFGSIYIDDKEKTLIEEGGFYEFPAYVVRWETTPGEKYGRGPGHIALPDARTLNRANYLKLEALTLDIRPPLLANQRDILGSVNMKPGAITVMKDIRGIAPFRSGTDVGATRFSTDELKESIKNKFYLDKLLLPPRNETGEMTAYETQVRIEQMQRVLGPTLGRLDSELLRPLITRTFQMLLRAGELPEIPESIRQEGLNVDIIFVNQLARSQQFGDITNIQGWANELSYIAQLNPEVLDWLDVDGIAKHTARVRGIPEVAIKDDEVVQQERQQRARQAQQQQMLDVGVQAADIQSKTGEI